MGSADRRCDHGVGEGKMRITVDDLRGVAGVDHGLSHGRVMVSGDNTGGGVCIVCMSNTKVM